MMMREDGTTNVINERVMSDEFARLLFKLLLLHASGQSSGEGVVVVVCGAIIFCLLLRVA